MPLFKSKSKKAFKDNMESEMDAGKPKDQSLAIAYSVQRKAKAKKYADGGPVAPSGGTAQDKAFKSIRDAFGPKPSPSPSSEQRAFGGEIGDNAPKSMAEAIMRKRRMKEMYAEGGEVDSNEEEMSNQYDDLNEDAAKKELYDYEDQLDAQPEESNEHSPAHSEEDAYDMIDKIRAKMRARRG